MPSVSTLTEQEHGPAVIAQRLNKTDVHGYVSVQMGRLGSGVFGAQRGVEWHRCRLHEKKGALAATRGGERFPLGKRNLGRAACVPSLDLCSKLTDTDIYRLHCHVCTHSV